jgi:hypothetical protein
MKIIITSEEKEIPVIVTKDLKIKDLKIALKKLPDISLEEKYLIFEGRVLREEETLELLDIQNSSIISLRKPEKILIYIKTEDVSKIPAVITNDINVHKLSEIIQLALGYTMKNQSLYFDGKLLASNKALMELGIKDFDSIQLFNNIKLPNQPIFSINGYISSDYSSDDDYYLYSD